MKRLLQLGCLFLILVGSMPVAHAQETIPEVSNLSELQAAIVRAEEGDTIKIMQTIEINEPVNIGIMDKHITITAYGTVDTMFSIMGDWTDTVGFFDLTINGDFSGVGESKIIIDTAGSVHFQNVAWETCQSMQLGGAIRVTHGSVYVSVGSFYNCVSDHGGAVYVDVDGAFYPVQVDFTGNSARKDGGAIYSCGTLVVDQCAFEYNSATNRGGAICGATGEVRESTIKENHASYGGGVMLTDYGTILNSKIYNNVADLAGADVFSPGILSINADDYTALFSEEMNQGGYNVCGWYNDQEDNRYSEESPTELLTSTENVTHPALRFAMYESVSEPEPEPDPQPEPEPTPEPAPEPDTAPDTPERVIIIERVIEKEVESPREDKVSDIKNITYGNIEFEGQAAAELISTIKRFIPTTEPITRGTTAAFIYGLMTEDSQVACIRQMRDFYGDMANSPYKTAANALTAVGVLSGRSDGLLGSGDILTYGQLLTVLTRLASLPENFVPFTTEQSHWAEAARQTAVAVGWFPDLPVNLDAPATYGAFVDLLSRAFEIQA